MAKAPTAARPVAPGVDPIDPVKQPDVATTNDAPAVREPVVSTEDLPDGEKVSVRTKEGTELLMDPYSAVHYDREAREVSVTQFVRDELDEGGRLEKA